MMTALEPALKGIVEGALDRDKRSLGKLVSLFENASSVAATQRPLVMRELEANATKLARIIGFTGTPGAGKSTLIGEVSTRILAQNPEFSIAVLAVDPSSQISGGALLGDRTRVNIPVGDKRFFFRSQASRGEFGGLSFNSFQALRILRRCFDYVFIETVGIGQTEIEIQQLANHTCLILQPFAGDQVQFMKSGIMEIPDTFVVNKCDEEKLAKQSYHQLKATLKQFSFSSLDSDVVVKGESLFMVSAVTGIGLDAFVEHLLCLRMDFASFSHQEEFYLGKWLKEEYGRAGVQRLGKQFDLILSDNSASFEDRQQAIQAILNQPP